MTIANTIFARTVMGDKKVVYGKSVLSGGSSSGEVVTDLNRTEQFFMNVAGATQKGCSVNETFPLTKGTITAVVETANGTFYWMAIGY